MSGNSENQQANNTEKLTFPVEIVKADHDERLAFEEKNLARIRNNKRLEKFKLASNVIFCCAATAAIGAFVWPIIPILISTSVASIYMGTKNYKNNMKQLDALEADHKRIYNARLNNAEDNKIDFDKVKIDKKQEKAFKKEKIIEDMLLKHAPREIRNREEALNNLASQLNADLVKQWVNDDKIPLRQFKKQFAAEMKRVMTGGGQAPVNHGQAQQFFQQGPAFQQQQAQTFQPTNFNSPYQSQVTYNGQNVQQQSSQQYNWPGTVSWRVGDVQGASFYQQPYTSIYKGQTQQTNLSYFPQVTYNGQNVQPQYVPQQSGQPAHYQYHCPGITVIFPVQDFYRQPVTTFNVQPPVQQPGPQPQMQSSASIQHQTFNRGAQTPQTVFAAQQHHPVMNPGRFSNANITGQLPSPPQTPSVRPPGKFPFQAASRK